MPTTAHTDETHLAIVSSANFTCGCVPESTRIQFELPRNVFPRDQPDAGLLRRGVMAAEQSVRKDFPKRFVGRVDAICVSDAIDLKIAKIAVRSGALVHEKAALPLARQQQVSRLFAAAQKRDAFQIGLETVLTQTNDQFAGCGLIWFGPQFPDPGFLFRDVDSPEFIVGDSNTQRWWPSRMQPQCSAGKS